MFGGLEKGVGELEGAVTWLLKGVGELEGAVTCLFEGVGELEGAVTCLFEGAFLAHFFLFYILKLSNFRRSHFQSPNNIEISEN